MYSNVELFLKMVMLGIPLEISGMFVLLQSPHFSTKTITYVDEALLMGLESK